MPKSPSANPAAATSTASAKSSKSDTRDSAPTLAESAWNKIKDKIGDESKVFEILDALDLCARRERWREPHERWCVWGPSPFYPQGRSAYAQTLLQAIQRYCVGLSTDDCGDDDMM